MTLNSRHHSVHLIDELHDRTPERNIHHVAARLDLAAIGDLVGLRISAAFDPDLTAVTPLSETCLIRTAAGIAEVPLIALANPVRKPVNRFLHTMEESWGWLEAVDRYEPLRAEPCPDNTSIDMLCLRGAIAVLTRPTADPLPLADLVGLRGSVAGLFVQHPGTARRGKATRRTVEALAEVVTSLTGLPADRAMLIAACEQVAGRSADRRSRRRDSDPVRSAAGETPTGDGAGAGRSAT